MKTATSRIGLNRASLVVAALLSIAVQLSAQESSSQATRFLAWTLASHVSLAALGHGNGADVDVTSRMVDRVRPAATYFGATIPPFPAKTGSSAEDAAQVLNYLLNTFGDGIGDKIGANFPSDHLLLFEVALKSNILLLMYVPGDEIGRGIATVIRDRAPRAGIPYDIWRPVVTSIEEARPFEEVKDAVVRMHDRMNSFLAIN